MFPINKFAITKVSESETAGVFQIGPLPKGYGHTIGNTFRRVLLSGIPGAAVTAVKISGVQHEYSTLAGLQDDILSVVLNLKGLAVISHSEEPVKLTIKAKGSKGEPKVVTAGDLSKDAMIEIINPEYVITTLADDKAVLDAEITVARGFGYAMPDDQVRTEVGTIPVDAMFNPVKLVSVNITNTRVGQQTDLDQVDLTVETNGAITPSAAMHQAADILVKMSEHMLSSAQNMLSAKAQKQVANSLSPVSDEIDEVAAGTTSSLELSSLDLSTRLTNALLNNGYTDLRQLDGMTEEELANIKGMGEKSLTELLDVLRSHGVKVL